MITKYSVMREKLLLLREYLLILEDIEDNRRVRNGENEFFLQLMQDALMEAQILFGKGN